MNSNILYINKETSLEEIKVFISKSIYCKINSLFLIYIPYYITNTQKISIIKFLKKNLIFSEITKSCLIILFDDCDSEFHQAILKNNIKSIKFPEILDFDSKIKKEILNVNLISSNICGLGKSTNIKNFNEEIIYLPIGGDITKEEFIHRIINSFNKIKIDRNKKYILHIDLTQTNNIEMRDGEMRDF